MPPDIVRCSQVWRAHSQGGIVLGPRRDKFRLPVAHDQGGQPVLVGRRIANWPEECSCKCNLPPNSGALVRHLSRAGDKRRRGHLRRRWRARPRSGGGKLPRPPGESPGDSPLHDDPSPSPGFGMIPEVAERDGVGRVAGRDVVGRALAGQGRAICLHIGQAKPGREVFGSGLPLRQRRTRNRHERGKCKRERGQAIVWSSQPSPCPGNTGLSRAMTGGPTPRPPRSTWR